MIKTLLRHSVRTLLVIAGLLVILITCAQFLSPTLPREQSEVDPDVLKTAEAMRHPQIDIDNPMVLYRDVDYSQGKQAAWYPKGQSPLLEQLVQNGELPPVDQRVGPEPAVFKAVEGIGQYGGSWLRVASNRNTVTAFMNYSIRATALVRYSPNGYPIVPGLAKSYEVNDDSTVFTFHLRQGVKWSDGHPFTADDILFWWNYWAKWQDPDTGAKIGYIPETMKIKGQIGEVRKLDDYTVEYVFPQTNAIFLEYMASARGVLYTAVPAHYLKKYHPAFADRQELEQIKKHYQLATDQALYNWAVDLNNPLRPSLSPWIMRTERTTGPFTMVRNPFYWAVDEQGNQLPYMDRVVYQIKNPGMENLALTSGQTTFQNGKFADYTLFMSQRQQAGYEVLHWYPSSRSELVIYPNLNRKVETDDPQTQFKHDTLNDRRFRRALSMAIDRQRIIDAEWAGVGKPSQVEPGPASLYHSDDLANSFVKLDPDQANALLNDMGLTQRDSEGYRTDDQGRRLTFFMITGTGQAITRICQFILEDWEKIGIRVMLLERPGRLYQIEKFGLTADLLVGTDNSSHNPLTGGIFFPDNGHCSYASAFGSWYKNGGLLGQTQEGIAPPVGHPLRRIMQIFDHACTIADPHQRAKVFKPALELFADEVYAISIATPPPQIYVVDEHLRNVPHEAISSFIDYRTPNNAVPEMWYLDQVQQDVSEQAAIVDEISHITMRDAVAGSDNQTSALTQDNVRQSSRWVGGLIRWMLTLTVVAAVLLMGIRHPFVIRRLMIMVPTLLVISVIVFTMIQLPPGDYLTARINQLQLSGQQVSDQEIAQLREQFHLNDSMVMRYFKWMGFDYFRTWDATDKGLLQGDLGLSMSEMKPVNEVVGDRVLLTMLISLGTILLTWILALPIGIYSAVKQYSPSDYVLTFLGFTGMCIPQFLLALVAIYLADRYVGIQVTGLFSVEYALTPAWSMGKVVDLLKHIWLPILLLGVGGTAGMIRIMRANLLDELKKPYVVTARAKGVGPIKLLLKYPVRIALNPFISGIGHIFPDLISGGAIVAMILSLPTVGPLMLDAVMIEDTQLAGSMLMVLSLLGIFGVLVSDLLLIAIDPRIRLGAKG